MYIYIRSYKFRCLRVGLQLRTCVRTIWLVSHQKQRWPRGSHSKTCCTHGAPTATTTTTTTPLLLLPAIACIYGLLNGHAACHINQWQEPQQGKRVFVCMCGEMSIFCCWLLDIAMSHDIVMTSSWQNYHKHRHTLHILLPWHEKWRRKVVHYL